ncbi:glycyl-trna synthetase [Cystoisospora suis]|uniref:glycine--tRNA ligase n=1 Tax=Cystoisospora suis TaxID=483139 RepID=A0A2C6KYT4_9APIC|nr:glycyl-trna synthetase [Cystoisospora suis]
MHFCLVGGGPKVSLAVFSELAHSPHCADTYIPRFLSRPGRTPAPTSPHRCIPASGRSLGTLFHPYTPAVRKAFFTRRFRHCPPAFSFGGFNLSRNVASGVTAFTGDHEPKRLFATLPCTTSQTKMATNGTAGEANGATLDLSEQLRGLRVQVTQKGEHVRLLKQANASAEEIAAAVDALGQLRAQVGVLEKQLESSRPLYYQLRTQCENLLKRRFFIAPAYEIYGGVGGLYDFGPPGCALKAAVEQLWRQHFVLAEDMLEVSGPCLTPHIVLKTSGHVDRFTDLMVKDTVTNDCLRADKYLEEKIDERLNAREGVSPGEAERLSLLRRQADALSVEEMKKALEDLHVKSPAGNPLSDPFPFNLMFGLKIGPKDESSATSEDGQGSSSNSNKKSTQNKAGSHARTAEGKGYLRPETAQGIFVNFRRLLEYNGGRMPFAAAQLGLGFRNEIAPRNGLLRVREFQMGEIEHFVHPDRKEHPKFDQVRGLRLPLFSREKQLTDGKVIRDLTLGEAVAKKIVDNETLGYFLARTYLFLLKCGIAESGLRFRQHLTSEMAHYAKDCWDAEIECSYGWIEVAGHADRAAFDLSNHSKVSKVDLVAFQKYDVPRVIEYVKYTPNKGLCGKTFKDRQQVLHDAIEEKSDDERLAIEEVLAKEGEYTLTLCNGESFKVTRDMMKFEKTSKKVSEESFTPAVIEPSFGIGRIIHCILEHAFRSRGIVDQEERCYMAFPAVIAPTKCVILPISSNASFNDLLNRARAKCVTMGVSTKIDASTASIGKRYARNDEIGTPFAITVDFDSLKDDSVTVRERDSMEQIRTSLTDAVELVAAMSQGSRTWADVKKNHTLVVVKEN